VVERHLAKVNVARSNRVTRFLTNVMYRDVPWNKPVVFWRLAQEMGGCLRKSLA
jgi:hypothetical protein